jgi:hypothetical protein
VLHAAAAAGDHTPDLAALLAADVIIATPEKWDGISRNWQTRGYVKKVRPPPAAAAAVAVAAAAAAAAVAVAAAAAAAAAVAAEAAVVNRTASMLLMDVWCAEGSAVRRLAHGRSDTAAAAAGAGAVQVGLLIIDEIHLLGADRGPVLEVIVSRMRWALGGFGLLSLICVGAAAG